MFELSLNATVDIWFMDEFHFQQHGSRSAAWFPWDVKDPVIKHAPTRKKIGIIGAVQAQEGKLIAREEDKFNTQSIEAFFDELCKHKVNNKIMVVIIDNARFHHAKALQSWLDDHKEGFVLEFLLPYSPELNHIKRVWKLLRRLCTHNQYFVCLDKLRQTVFEKLSEWSLPNKVLLLSNNTTGFNRNKLKTQVFCLFFEFLFQTLFVVRFLLRKQCFIKEFLILD